jgi:hypothetical protein
MDKASSDTVAFHKSNIHIDEEKGIILNRLKGRVTTESPGRELLY